MRNTPLAVMFLTLSGATVGAQTYSTYPMRQVAAAPAQPAGHDGSSVAYGQPLFYVQRLRPARYYPPTRYGYIEVTGQGANSGGPIRTGR